MTNSITIEQDTLRQMIQDAVEKAMANHKPARATGKMKLPEKPDASIAEFVHTNYEKVDRAPQKTWAALADIYKEWKASGGAELGRNYFYAAVRQAVGVNSVHQGASERVPFQRRNR